MTEPFGSSPMEQLFKRQSSGNLFNFRLNLFKERLKIAKNLYKKDLVSHFGCVNAIEFSREGELLVSGGDDRRVLLWQVEKSIGGKSPAAMEKQHQSNIFCLGFNSDNTKIFSGGNDDTVIVHDLKTGTAVDVFLHEKPVYGLSIDPLNDQIFSSAGEDGRILVFDLRLSSEVMCVAKYRSPFHAVNFHPMDGSLIITANAKEGAGLWDLRKPKNPVIRYGGEDASQSCMSVRFNTLGNLILALRRRLPPILYSTTSESSICQFYHPDYYNSCTMKSCCFAGEMDEYVLSGSDDFNLYAWRIDDVDMEKNDQWIDTNQLVLFGHRSIVNQVRYNPEKCIIASSGVEKIVKLWSPFPMNGWTGSLMDDNGLENPREVFSHDEYISLMNISIQNMAHDYSNQSTMEDPRMMAFFDSLVQQEIEGWNSTDSDSDQHSEHNSENSSRPPSTQSSSDTEQMSNFMTTRRQTGSGRRGSSNVVFKPQRTKYPNRIAYLIATKRNTLKRLALKRAANTTHRSKTSKFGYRKGRGSNLRTTRKLSGKRAARQNTKKTHMRRSFTCNDMESSKNVARRRIQQHLNTSSYRSFRRKYKTTSRTHFASSPSSSDTETNENETNESEAGPSTSSINLSMPSTSTGITSSNSENILFRIAQRQIDSDDDQSSHNSPPTLRINYPANVVPVNGKRKINGNQSSNEDDNRDEILNKKIRIKRNRASYNTNDIYSSHSNSRLSNSSYQEDGSSNDSMNNYFNNKMSNGTTTTTITTTTTATNGNGNDNENDESNIYKTPNKNPEIISYTPDSGILTAPGSSTSTADNNNKNTSTVEKNGTSVKLFKDGVTRVRRNYRNNFGDDSDSD